MELPSHPKRPNSHRLQWYNNYERTHTHTLTLTHIHPHTLTGYTLYTAPPPSGGPELLFPLNLLSLYTHHNPPSPPSPSPSPSASDDLNLTYHRMVEAFKYMFALRSQLGDTDCDGCDEEGVWRVVNDSIK